MHEGKTKGSQLITSSDGTLYHINLKRADNIPHNLLIMGAAGRVKKVAAFFDEITWTSANSERPEFCIACGTYRGVPVAAMSLGIGVANIEIALNELHALFEYDFARDTWAKKKAPVNIIRIGTCGTVHPVIQAGSFVISQYALGLDNLGAFYPLEKRAAITRRIEKQFLKTPIGRVNPLAYVSQASPPVYRALLNATLDDNDWNVIPTYSGITLASPAFYAAEGRAIGRIKTAFSSQEFISAVQEFQVGRYPHGNWIANLEMETSILFRLGYERLGYNVGAICLVVDNLATDEVIEKPVVDKRMDHMIVVALETMVALAKRNRVGSIFQSRDEPQLRMVRRWQLKFLTC